MSDVRSRLATTGFEFKPEWARVIAGEEEGVYGWLSVNLLENSLHDGADAWAALDFGGASTQITVPPAQTLLSNLFNLQLGDSLNTNLYTHSCTQWVSLIMCVSVCLCVCVSVCLLSVPVAPVAPVAPAASAASVWLPACPRVCVFVWLRADGLHFTFHVSNQTCTLGWTSSVTA